MKSLFMRYPGGVPKALTFSYDDGVESDIRFMKILDKYSMKGTFNIGAGCFAPEGTVYPEGTVHRRMSKKECVEAYTGTNHEVAIHGFGHPFWEQLPPAAATIDIIDDRRGLEEVFSRIIRGGAYPFGSYGDDVVEILKNAGIVYCRTTQSTLGFKLPADWLRLHPTCHHNNPELMKLAEDFVNNPGNRSPLLFYLWGHTYEFDGCNNWNVIEEFCEFMSDREDVWYCTNIELYDYVKAFKSLEFSADMKMVHNPSVIKVYFEFDEKTYSVNSDETINL